MPMIDLKLLVESCFELKARIFLWWFEE